MGVCDKAFQVPKQGRKNANHALEGQEAMSMYSRVRRRLVK